MFQIIQISETLADNDLFAVAYIEMPLEQPNGQGVANRSAKACIWSLRERRKVVEFPIIIDPGEMCWRMELFQGERNPVLVAASYYRHGVWAYNANDGTVLWQRKDLTKQDGLRQLTGEGGIELVGIHFGNRSPKGEMVLAVESMKTIRLLKGAEGVWTSPDGTSAVRRSKSEWQFGTLTDDVPLWTHSGPPPGGVWFDAAFGPNLLVVTDGATTRGFSVDGTMLWTIESFLTTIRWHDELGAWVGLSSRPKESTAAVVINVRGRELSRRELPVWLPRSRLSSTGSYLIGSDGRVSTFPDLEVVWQFAQPCGDVPSVALHP